MVQASSASAAASSSSAAGDGDGASENPEVILWILKSKAYPDVCPVKRSWGHSSGFGAGTFLTGGPFWPQVQFGALRLFNGMVKRTTGTTE